MFVSVCEAISTPSDRRGQALRPLPRPPSPPPPPQRRSQVRSSTTGARKVSAYCDVFELYSKMDSPPLPAAVSQNVAEAFPSGDQQACATQLTMTTCGCVCDVDLMAVVSVARAVRVGERGGAVRGRGGMGCRTNRAASSRWSWCAHSSLQTTAGRLLQQRTLPLSLMWTNGWMLSAVV